MINIKKYWKREDFNIYEIDEEMFKDDQEMMDTIKTLRDAIYARTNLTMIQARKMAISILIGSVTPMSYGGRSVGSHYSMPLCVKNVKLIGESDNDVFAGRCEAKATTNIYGQKSRVW